MLKDLGLMGEYIDQARHAGCGAVVISVDAPLGCAMCTTTATEPVAFPIKSLPLLPSRKLLPYNSLDEYYNKYIAPTTWLEVEQVIRATELPVILKGIMHPEDAHRALNAGAQGIIISNHGGRQLDGAVSTLSALTLVPELVRDSLKIYLDGGVRSGSDVFKALALGADAVLVGRPVLYALAAEGQQGVESLFRDLGEELRLTMQLCGAPSVQNITSDMLLQV